MAEYQFKTIYFPKDKVRAGKSVRLNISLPAKPKGGISDELITYLQSLDSREFRLAIGDPFLEDLEARATESNRSLSNLCFSMLRESFHRHNDLQKFTHQQGILPFEDLGTQESRFVATSGPIGLGVTFEDNFRKGAFGWYPYVEGFSAQYVRDALLRDGKKPRAVYDPFGGSGTTQLSASLLGIDSFYSELNPFMSFVAETKITSAYWARRNLNEFTDVADTFIQTLRTDESFRNLPVSSLDAYHQTFPERDYFETRHITDLLTILDFAKRIAAGNRDIENLLLLGCISNAVAASNMTRRADLRRRRPDEYKNRVVDVPNMVATSVERMLSDIRALPLFMAPTHKVSNDAKSIPHDYVNAFDLVLTSPPYLNGTNYFRNTKIELWLSSFITSEKDLRKFRDLCVTGGINDVSEKESYTHFDSVETVASKLDDASRDRRIPTMVRHYFSDMHEVMSNISKSLVPGGKCLLDIGDSKFYGVHVPTDKLLIEVAQSCGLTLVSSHLLAKRLSRDKSELTQVELVFQKPKKGSFKAPSAQAATASPNVANTSLAEKTLKEKIELFQAELPYKHEPYTKKTWGHPLHSLCSYQGKLKPAIAHWLVNTFVPENGTLLDPIGGVGTIPFEGAIAGRRVVSNDKSPFASLIAKAKLNPPLLSEVKKCLDELREFAQRTDLSQEEYSSAEFGLNARIKDYFHPDTLEQILRLRKIFLRSNSDCRSAAENFIWASLLHVLHGNRPYALSRTSHPITPFSPSGPFVFKDAFEKIFERAKRSLAEPLPTTFIPGRGIHGDFRDLPQQLEEKYDAIITSPPFYGMRFDRPNWMRLWFCGWEEKHFKEDSLEFLERQQTKDVRVYETFFEVCNHLLKHDGCLIIHLGSGGTRDLVEEFKAMAPKHFHLSGAVTENVQAIASHGIKDKGMTTSHTLLFFSRNSITA